MSQLPKSITPDLLRQTIDFWFSHFTSEHELIAPPQEAVSKWFKRDEQLDKACV